MKNKLYKIVETEIGFRQVIAKSSIKKLKKGCFIDDEWKDRRMEVFIKDDFDLIKIRDQMYADSLGGATSIYYCEENNKYLIEHNSYTENRYSMCWWLDENCYEIEMSDSNEIARKELEKSGLIEEEITELPEGYMPF